MEWVLGQGYWFSIHMGAQGVPERLHVEATDRVRERVFRHVLSGKHYGFPITRSSLEELFGQVGEVRRGTAVVGWR